MANIGNDTFQHIYGAPDEATLIRILQFTQSGKQDESNAAARELINRRLEEMKAKRQAEETHRQMVQEAKDYRSRQQGEADKLYAEYEDQGRRALSARMAGVTQNANQRGLLYSGLKQRSQLDALRDYATGMGSIRARSNAVADETGQALERRAAQAGLRMQQAASDASMNDYKLNQEIAESKNRLRSEAFQNIGAIGGKFAGRGRA